MATGGTTRRAALALGAGMLLSGCAGARIWPFGGGRSRVPAAQAQAVAAEDPSMLLSSLRFAAAERGRQGVILRAEGIAPTLGFHAPELRQIGVGADGIALVELRARPPLAQEAAGPERARLIRAARFYPVRALRDIRGFQVVTAQNGALARF